MILFPMTVIVVFFFRLQSIETFYIFKTSAKIWAKFKIHILSMINKIAIWSNLYINFSKFFPRPQPWWGRELILISTHMQNVFYCSHKLIAIPKWIFKRPKKTSHKKLINTRLGPFKNIIFIAYCLCQKWPAKPKILISSPVLGLKWAASRSTSPLRQLSELQRLYVSWSSNVTTWAVWISADGGLCDLWWGWEGI